MRRIFIAGHLGMVGSSILGELRNDASADLITRSRSDLDLTDQHQVLSFFEQTRPSEVILAAAKVGGIYANSTFPAEFIYQNLQIQNNVIHASHVYDVDKLLFLGSSCIYPKLCDQPILEDHLLTGALEQTNEPYAIAKIAGIKMCEAYNRQYGRDYRAVMPTNLYGPNDNYHPKNSHVVPALIRRFHEAKVNQSKVVEIWGSGEPKREFMYVADLAKACVFIHNLDRNVFEQQVASKASHINIGVGCDVTIRELALVIKKIVQFSGDIVFDNTKPDGTPRKLLDVSLLKNLGWCADTNLEDGIRKTYSDFLRNHQIFLD